LTKYSSDDDFKVIEDALHIHKLLIFKAQPAMLLPQQQYKLTSMFDPNGPGGFAHAGDEKVLMTHNGIDIYGIVRVSRNLSSSPTHIVL
jgi:hypothetical protein